MVRPLALSRLQQMLLSDSEQAIDQAAAVLRDGQLVGLPTETVYGLAADADNPAAVARIFSLKGRPSDHPLIVHVHSAEQVPLYASAVPSFAKRLIAAHWPGPLTLILPRQLDKASQAAGGHRSVGLRCPAHPLAQAVLKAALALGVTGLAAPSANRFGRVSPTQASHVQDEFGDALWVLDGGACSVGIESTIIDCTRGHPVLLRPGVLDVSTLGQAAGEPVLSDLPASFTANATDTGTAKPGIAPAPRASGTLVAHYAPQATLRLLTPAQLACALAERKVSGQPARLAVWSTDTVAQDGVLHQPLPAQADQAAHQLFAQLRLWDAAGVSEIWVQHPPAEPAWNGVRDRLQRAAAAFEPTPGDSR